MTRAATRSKERGQARGSSNRTSPAKPGPLLTGKRLYAILCILLAGATVTLYSPVLGNSFVVIDDREYVTENPHIHAGLAWSTVKWAFTSTDAFNWHPLTWLSHALDYQLFALNPSGHHLDSVLIHALNVVVLFLLLAWLTKRVGSSLLVAALFAVHPLNVESVAWVSERKNVLSTLFFFLAIAAYALYARKPDWRRYLLVAALFAAGLMAKPMVITLPFVLLLLDYWPLERSSHERSSRERSPLENTLTSPTTSDGIPGVSFTRLLLEKIPLLLLPVASAWITVKAQRGAVRTFEQFPFGLRIENAIVAYALYLWKMVWPARLAVLYPHPTAALPVWQWLLSALFLLSITALVITLRRKRYLLVGWFWFLGTLVPVIGLVQVGEASMADRYAYIPLVGIFIMIAWGLDDLAERKKVRTAWRVIPALCILTALALVTHRQMSYWSSEYTLWSHTLAVTERNPIAQSAIAHALMHPELAMTQHDLANFDTEQKRTEEARRHYEELLKICRPLAQQNSDVYPADVATTLDSLTTLDLREGRTSDARQHGEEALQIHRQLADRNSAKDKDLPYMAMTLNNLEVVDLRQNRMEEARQHGEEALKINRQLAQQEPDAHLPELALTLNNLGDVERLQNQLDAARQHFEEALQINRRLAAQNPTVYPSGLALTLKDLGLVDLHRARVNEARQHFDEALKMYRQLARQNPDAALPDMAATLSNLGIVNLRQNRMDEARECFEQALNAYHQLAQHDPARYVPYVASTLQTLGNLDRHENRIEESRTDYQQALTLFRQLSQTDSKYLADVATTEASLQELGKRDTPSQ